MKKKIFAFVPAVLAVIYLAVPLMWLIAVATDRYFQLDHPLAMAIVLTVISVAAAVAMLVCRIEYDGINSAVASVILFLSAVTQAYFIYHAVSPIDGYETLVPALVTAVGTIANIVIFVQCVEDNFFKATCGVITVLFSILIVGYCVYLLVSSNIYSEKLIKDGPDSPDGGYKVTVTVHEAGLLTDGKTYVNVRDTAESGALFGTLKYRAQRVYSGDEKQQDLITIDWFSEDTLLINGEPYSVTGKKLETEEPAESSAPEAEESSEDESEISEESTDGSAEEELSGDESQESATE